MAQTPVTRRQSFGNTMDYTPVGAVTGGDVVVIGVVPWVAPVSIAAGVMGALEAEGEYVVPKDASVFAAGDAVYWNPTGNPVGGAAGSGCATSTPGVNLFGMATKAAATGVATVNAMHAGISQVTGVAVAGQSQVLAAAGADQAGAGAITVTNGFVHATGADAAKGVRLPAAVAGRRVTIKNSDAANAVLLVYPATGDAINAIAANGPFSMPAKTSATFDAIDGTTWYTTPLVPS